MNISFLDPIGWDRAHSGIHIVKVTVENDYFEEIFYPQVSNSCFEAKLHNEPFRLPQQKKIAETLDYG